MIGQPPSSSQTPSISEDTFKPVKFGMPGICSGLAMRFVDGESTRRIESWLNGAWVPDRGDSSDMFTGREMSPEKIAAAGIPPTESK